MSGKERTYVAIDLKSFYASVECVERGLDPLGVHLVVADPSRTQKTICLAVSPALKSHGVSGRPRLFEVVERVKAINARRRAAVGRLQGKSYIESELENNPALALDFLIAPPRMAFYMAYSTRIYDIYLRFVAPEDMHVYSVDEVFIDLTDYLKAYKTTARELTGKMLSAVYAETGITATAGIGTNLYLCKVAMDIVAKHAPPDKEGKRIAELTEAEYRRTLWSHTPITDFWRIGAGYAAKLQSVGLTTMGDVARCSLGKKEEYYNEDLLYKLFGVNAELLIDHAWGYEPCTIADIRAYRPQSRSLGQGQVLREPYSCEKGKRIVREMTDALALDLVEKGLVSDKIVLEIGYDVENPDYTGEKTSDRYGRAVPKHAHGTANLQGRTSSAKRIWAAVQALFDKIVDSKLFIRRINLTACDIRPDSPESPKNEQLDLFTDYAAREQAEQSEREELEKEKAVQQALLNIKEKYGKNAIVKGMSLEEGATAMERNAQIGGHKA